MNDIFFLPRRYTEYHSKRGGEVVVAILRGSTFQMSGKTFDLFHRCCSMHTCASPLPSQLVHGLRRKKGRKRKRKKRGKKERGLIGPTVKPCLHYPHRSRCPHMCQSHYKRLALSSLGSSALPCQWLIVVSMYNFGRPNCDVDLPPGRLFLGNVATQKRLWFVIRKQEDRSFQRIDLCAARTWRNNITELH